MPQPNDERIDAIRDFVRTPIGRVAVGTLTEVARKALGAGTNEVLLSDQTLLKQAVHHPELQVDEYLFLPKIIGGPELIIQDRERHVVLLRTDTRLYQAVVKATRDGGETYVVSFRRADAQGVRRLLTRGNVIAGNEKKWRAGGASA